MSSAICHDVKLLDLSRLDAATVSATPFPHLVIEDFLAGIDKHQLLADLPEIDLGGSIPLEQTHPRGLFAQLLDELFSDALKQRIAEKFQLDLHEHPAHITYRARARMKDGRIHTDSKSKLITVLFYLNPQWEHDAGRLRLLYNDHDLDHYAAEITPLLGTCLIFQVTDNCWHGHYPLGASRRSIQLNYLVDESAKRGQSQKHRFSAWVKKLLG